MSLYFKNLILPITIEQGVIFFMGVAKQICKLWQMSKNSRKAQFFQKNHDKIGEKLAKFC